MKKLAATLVAISGVLLGGYYLWPDRDEAIPASADPIPEARAIEVPKPAQPEEPRKEDEPAPSTPVEPGARLPLPPLMPPANGVIPQRPGFNRIPMSDELQTYVMLIPISAAAAITEDGKYVDEAALKRVQQQYGLSDEELSKFAEYARASVQKELADQAKAKEQVCSMKATYRSAEEFGAALNQIGRDNRTRQESLGREAESKLGPELFPKIVAPIRSAPRRESTQYDFQVIFRERRSDLATEVDQFCGQQKQ